MKRVVLVISFVLSIQECCSWGFFAHRKINYYAAFLLPPEMLVFYKPNLEFLAEHAVDPDKRRYLLPAEGARHYIDLDRYGQYPFRDLPRNWSDAAEKFSEDTLRKHGIVPWWIMTMMQRLTTAFRQKDRSKILKLSAEIGHYIADAHVPLHACSNHNGQFTNQAGIHGFWESTIPELLAETDWDFLIGKTSYLNNPHQFIWNRVLESANAVDSVLKFEKELSSTVPPDRQFAFEERNGTLVRKYSTYYTILYNRKLNDMVERRMRQSIYSVAAFWYTAWVNAGQPELKSLAENGFTERELQEFELLNSTWLKNNSTQKEH